MMTLILATFLTATPAPTQTAQFRPCVWPNTCKTVVAPVIAEYEPCVMPNKCVAAPVVASGPVTTCVWPNKCG